MWESYFSCSNFCTVTKRVMTRDFFCYQIQRTTESRASWRAWRQSWRTRVWCLLSAKLWDFRRRNFDGSRMGRNWNQEMCTSWLEPTLWVSIQNRG